jgi:ABC-type cobalamin/Fe3+-siderophores transport system ATPase subunit
MGKSNRQKHRTNSGSSSQIKSFSEIEKQMEHTVIEIQNAVVSYREDVALRGVSLRVNRGEFVGIIGPNGAGKTTLLTTVNGTGKLASGRVRVLDHYLTPGNGHSIRKKVGYVAQAQNIDPRLPVNVRDAVMIGRYGLLGLFKRPDLSGGEQQKVAIARCLAQEPEIFLLDEPTVSLDWKAQADILQLVKLIHNSQRLTTIFITHDLSALPNACSRIVLMKQGFIWGQGTPGAMLTDINLSKVYEVPIDEVKNRRRENIAA